MTNRSGSTNDRSNKGSRAASASAASAKAVVPALRYRDLGAAVVWLCEVFDFKQGKMLANEDGHLIYAELSFGDSMVMLGSMHDQNVGRLFKQPDEIGGAETQTCYLLIDDVEAQYDRAKLAGAEFVSVISHDDSEALSFGCRDIEGHIWFFGEHAPRAPAKPSGWSLPQVFGGAMVASLVLSVVAWSYVGYVDKQKQQTAAESLARSASEQAARASELAARERSLRESTAKALTEAKSLLAQNRRERDAANDAMIDAAARMTAERVSRKKTDSQLQSVKRQLERQQSANQIIDQKLSRLHQALLAERARGRKAEERAAERIEKERTARQRADLKAAAALARIEKLQAEMERLTTRLDKGSSITGEVIQLPEKRPERVTKALPKERRISVSATREARQVPVAGKPPISASSDVRLRVRVR